MNKGIIFAIGALVGGAVGSFSTWYLTNKKLEEKYQAIANEEIKSVKDTYKEKYEKDDKTTSQNASVTHQEPRRAILGGIDGGKVVEEEKTQENANKRSKEYTDYTQITRSEGYDNAEYESPKEEIELKPFLISPQEFDLSQNEKISMHYYLDGTLTDDMDNPVQPSDYFGNIDIENSFDDYSDEPDIVFIRDPKLKLDYEITKILVRYPETTGEWMGD